MSLQPFVSDEPQAETPLYVLDTHQPEAMTYRGEEILYTILGGVRLDGLDRLRVTLKVEVINRKFAHYLNNPDIADLALRHNLDLYNDTQVERLTRKTAERLEVGSTPVARAIADITAQLEAWRIEQIQQQKPDNEPPCKVLTDEEREQAIAFLSQPHLLTRTNTAIGESGVIGEETNRLLMYLIFTSRKREHPLHVVSLGSSGTGKTYLQEGVSSLIPDEDKLEITTLSDNAFYYFERNELKNKLILLEDLTGADGVLYPIRELQSKKRITKTVTYKNSKGVTRTVHLTVEGPVCVAGCTTQESIYEDNANRSFLIYLDESPAQDERIMDYQRQRSAGRVNTEYETTLKYTLQNTQRLLEPISVRNPYAEQLCIPNEVFKPRRTNSHYLQFIEAITFYHQYQRVQKCDETTGEVYIETAIEDIQAANTLMKDVLLRKSDELNTACRKYLETLKNYLAEHNKSAFTAKEVRQALRINHSNQKRYMLMLQDNNYIRSVKNEKGQPTGYEIVSPGEYSTLQSRINNVLDNILNRLKNETSETPSVQSSKAVQSGNEPHNTLRTKGKRPPVQKSTVKDM